MVKAPESTESQRGKEPNQNETEEVYVLSPCVKTNKVKPY